MWGKEKLSTADKTIGPASSFTLNSVFLKKAEKGTYKLLSKYQSDKPLP